MKKIIVLVIIFLILIGGIVSYYKMNGEDHVQIKTWAWDTEKILKNSDEYISFIAEKQCDEIYLYIHYDIDISLYQKFIKELNKIDVEVHALGGEALWIEDINLNTKFFNWIKNYQKKVNKDEKFKGIHIDVEPYLTESWKKNRNKTIEDFQTFAVISYNESKKLNLKIIYDIPFWYDEIEFNNKFGKNTLSNWLLENVDSVMIMAYRNKAKNIMKQVDSEIKYAEKINKKISIAVETDKTDEGENISFFDHNKKELNTEISIIETKFRKNNSYNGIGIHHLTSWMNLKD